MPGLIVRAAEPASWAPLVAGFCAYVALFTIGHYLHAPSLNVAGALTMLYFALVGNFHRMFELSREPAVRWALLLLAAFAAAYAASPETSDLALTLKYDTGLITHFEGAALDAFHLVGVEKFPGGQTDTLRFERL